MSLLERSQLASVQPVKFILNWGRRYSLWLLNFGLACCGIELIASAMSKHDLIRFGVIPVAHGPRQADLLIIAGTVTDKMAPVLRRVYEQMPEPKYVISFGSCSNVGGPYWDSYSVTKGSTRSSRSTCSSPAARRGPRRCSTGSSCFSARSPARRSRRSGRGSDADAGRARPNELMKND